MDIQEILKDRYKVLPPDMQKVISGSDYYLKLTEICKKYNLHVDQSGALQTETILVMLGLESANSYSSNIQNALEISKESADRIAKDISDSIFVEVRDSLKKIDEMRNLPENTHSSVDILIDRGIPLNSVPKNPIAPPIITPYTKAPQTIPDQKTLREATSEQGPTQIPISKTISNIERVGQFKVEKDPLSSSPQYKEDNINREALLKQIEDAPVPLVDHLLANPIINSNKTQTEKEVPNKSVDNKSYSLDPYREQI